MSNVNSIKDPSVKVNRNWGHNRPIVSSTPGEYAYLSPLIREVCVRCKDLNVYLMNLLNNMSNIKNDGTTQLDNTALVTLNKYHPDILRRVIYDQEIYNNVIEALSLLCEHNNYNGSCDMKDCPFNTSK